MKITLKNFVKAMQDQGPLTRFIKNLWKGHVLGLFHERSHMNGKGQMKVAYGSKKTAQRVAQEMMKKKGYYYSNYKCLFCDGYHLGRNRDHKEALKCK